jgi:hypothetical protein
MDFPVAEFAPQEALQCHIQVAAALHRQNIFKTDFPVVEFAPQEALQCHFQVAAAHKMFCNISKGSNRNFSCGICPIVGASVQCT